jgi:hypothetical protein
MVSAVIWFLLGITPALAGEMPTACSPETPYEICILIIQRNNALNDVAHNAGQQDLQEKKWKAEDEAKAEYWKKYIDGEEIQRQGLAQYWSEYITGMQIKTSRAAEVGRRH